MPACSHSPDPRPFVPHCQQQPINNIWPVRSHAPDPRPFGPHTQQSQHPTPRNPRTRRSLTVEDYATANSDQFYDRTRPFAQLLNSNAVDESANSVDDNDDDPFNQKTNSAGQQLRLRIRQFLDALRLQQPQATEPEQEQQSALQPAEASLAQNVVGPSAPLPNAVEPATATPSFEERAAALRAKWADMLAQRNIIPKERLLAIRRRKRRNIVSEYNLDPVGRSSAQFGPMRPRKHCPNCWNNEDASTLSGGGTAQQQYPLNSAYMQLVHGAPGPMQQQQQPELQQQTLHQQMPQQQTLPQPQQQPPQRYQQVQLQGNDQAQLPALQQHTAQAPASGSQPGFVFDRLGHRYIEHDGRYHLVVEDQQQKTERQLQQHNEDAVVFSAPPAYFPQTSENQPQGRADNTNDDSEYVILEDIINRNQPIIHASNIEGGHTIPEPIQLVRDTFGFLHELADSHNTKSKNYDYQIAQQRSSVVTAPEQQQQQQQQLYQQPQQPSPSKRSFAIVPLLQDQRDGSVVVRIAPHKSGASSAAGSTFAAKGKQTTDKRLKSKIAASTIEKSAVKNGRNNNGSKRKPESNAIPFDENEHANGRYDIVIGGDGTQQMEASDEDMEWMRLVYETADLQKEQHAGFRSPAEGLPQPSAEMSEIMASFET